MNRSEQIDATLERHKRKDLKKKKEKSKEEQYQDLPAHILNKLYR